MSENHIDIEYSAQQFKLIKQQNELLKNQLMNASLINELTKVMHTALNPEHILHTILLGFNEIAGFDRIILFEIDKENFTLNPKSWFGIDEFDKDKYIIPLGFEGGDITDAIFLNRHLIIENATPEEDFFSKSLNSESYIVIPLVGRTIPEYNDNDTDEGESISGRSVDNQKLSENDRRREMLSLNDFRTQGVFWIDRNIDKSPITSDDVTSLSLILNQAGLIIENITMYKALETANSNLQDANKRLEIVNQELRDAQAKINKDLDHARSIQQGLLPESLPDIEKLSIKGTYIPADAVGGDYYDVFEISEGVYGIIIADVSGHGVSSALIMTMVKVLLKTFAANTDSPQKTLEIINDIFQNETKTSNFVTVFYAILDTNQNFMRYNSAGHCPVLFLNKKDKSCIQIKADGLFLGVFPDMMLKETCYHYEPGTQRIILYTDGVTEARNEKGEMFELDRLEEVSKKTLEDSTEKACNEILSFQKEFRGSYTTPEDDITLLVVDF